MCIDLINLDKLHCREIYNILVYTSPHKPTSQVYFENLFRKQELNWKEIYTLPWKVSIDLNNVLYLNKKLFIFGKPPSSLYSFCKQADETIPQLFYECNIKKKLRNRLDLFFNDCFHLPQLLPQTVFFGFFNTYSNNLRLENHILLLFKIYLYISLLHYISSLFYITLLHFIVTLRKPVRIITKVKVLGNKVLKTMIKRLCCTRKNGKYWKNVTFLKNASG